MNSFGHKVIFTIFGESHGPAIGGVLDGIPQGLQIDLEVINYALDRRSGRTTPNMYCSPRAIAENDKVEWLSGLSKDNITLGTPIAFFVRNTDAHPEDYAVLKGKTIPGHLDVGGGHNSGRVTVAHVIAGSICRQWLQQQGITIEARLSAVGHTIDYFEEYLKQVHDAGDGCGGEIEGVIKGLPIGLGTPLFDKLQVRIASAVMSINGCIGFNYGVPQGLTSEREGTGGTVGGISDGTNFVFHCTFRAPATTPQTIRTLIGISDYPFRSDTCYVVRTPVIVEAMVAIALCDMMV